MKPKIFIACILVVATCVAAGWWFVNEYQDPPILAEYPQDPGQLDVTYPATSESLPKRFDIEGTAYAGWFYEGKLPMSIETPDGTLLWEGYAIAPDAIYDMLVSFRAHADVGRYRGPAVLVLDRDNPSGDPAYGKQVRIPIAIGSDVADDKYPYDPGQIGAYTAATGDTVARPLRLAGSASSRWFDGKGRIQTTIVASDGETVLWSGYATTADAVTRLHVADFSLSADVGTYLGDITVSFKAANPDGDSRYDATYLIDLSVQ